MSCQSQNNPPNIDLVVLIAKYQELLNLYNSLKAKIQTQCCKKKVEWGNIIGDITDQTDLITLIESIEIECQDIKDCLGISESGNPLYVLNQRGTWINPTLTGNPNQVLYFNPSGAVTSDSNFRRVEGGLNPYTSLSTRSIGSNIGGFLLIDPTSVELMYDSSGVDDGGTLLLQNTSRIGKKLAGSLDNYIEVASQGFSYTNVSSGVTLRYPLIDGNNGDVLTTDGSGILTFQPLGSSSSIWGSITGTLSDQTDLQNALNNKEDSLGFTPEDVANKATDFTVLNDTLYPTTNAVNELLINALSGLTNFFWYKTASDIGGYYQMKLAPSTGGTQTISASGLSDGDTIASFATNSGVPNVTLIPEGIIKSRIFAEKTSGTKTVQLYVEHYKRNLAGTETLIGTSGYSTVITLAGGVAQYNISTVLTADVTMLSTDRIVSKVKAYVTGGGSSPDITISMENDTASRIELPLPSLDLSSYELISNKTGTITGNESSTTLYSTIKGIVDWVKDGIASVIPAKSSALVDADLVPLFDSADSSKTKTRTWAQIKETLFLGLLNDKSTRVMLIDEDFITLHNFTSVNSTGSSQAGVATDATYNAHGILQLRAGTNTTASVMIRTQGANSIMLGSGKVVMKARIKFPVLSDGTNTYRVYIGLSDRSSAGGSISASASFQYGSDVNSGMWRIFTDYSGTTTTDTAIAVSTDWTVLQIEVNADRTSVAFYIDGVLVATHTTNIPLTVGWETDVRKSAGSNTIDYWIDYVTIYGEFTTPRP